MQVIHHLILLKTLDIYKCREWFLNKKVPELSTFGWNHRALCFNKLGYKHTTWQHSQSLNIFSSWVCFLFLSLLVVFNAEWWPEINQESTYFHKKETWYSFCSQTWPKWSYSQIHLREPSLTITRRDCNWFNCHFQSS